MAATDNYRVATETLALDAGVPGRYALDADACRAASAELRDGKGPVTLSQDARFLTLAWTDRLVVAKRQEPDLPDHERALKPSPTDWAAVGLNDLRDLVTEARAADTSDSGVAWIDASPDGGVTFRWTVDGGDVEDRRVIKAQVLSPFRVALALRYLAEMLGAWPDPDLRVGVVAQGKPVHFTSASQPGPHYGIMPILADHPDR